MNMSKLFVAALVVATAVSASAQTTPPAPPAAPAIVLSGVTGEVQIVTPGGTMTVKKGEPVPAIPAGSTIKVISGEAAVTAGKVTVNAGVGDSFTVNTNGAAVSIAVTGGSVSITGADGKTQEVPTGSGVTLVSTPVVVTPTATTTTKTEEPVAPESIPADGSGTTTITTPPSSSPLQETASCNGGVSPSAPCP